MNWRPLGVAAMISGSMLLAMAQPTPVVAKLVQDAHCDLTSQATSLVGSKAYSESFTAGRTGTLTRGFVESFNVQDSPATYAIQLWDADAFGLPAGTAPLASTTVDHPGSGFDFEFPIFATPAKVTKGQQYAWVVIVPNANLNGVTVSLNNPCPNTFALSADGSIGAFQNDPSNRDMTFSVRINVKRRHKH